MATTLLIQGMFHSNKSWAKWEAFFSEKGYHRLTTESSDHRNDPAFNQNALTPEGDATAYKEIASRIHDAYGPAEVNSHISDWIFLQGRQPGSQDHQS